MQLKLLQLHNEPVSTSEEHSEKDGLVADVACGGDLLFLYRESGVEDSLLTEQGNDSNEQLSLELEDTSVSESLHGSPPKNLGHGKLGIEHGDDPITDILTPSDSASASSIISVSEDVTCEGNPSSPRRECLLFDCPLC